MFGRATIRLGIGPHSSFTCLCLLLESGVCLYVYVSGQLLNSCKDRHRLYVKVDGHI